MSSRLSTDELAKKVYVESESALDELLKSFLYAIDFDQMPKADEILNKKSRNPKNKIHRPPNSNLLYTNLLNNFGLLEIIKKFCEKHETNKQNMVPISKKLSKILWNKISVNYKKFFDKLAAEVMLEHRKMYPDYKYAVYKLQTETDNEKPIHHQPADISMAQNSDEDKIDDAFTYDSQEECTSDESDGDDNFPTFNERRPSTPLSPLQEVDFGNENPQFPQFDHFGYKSDNF
jgi:hypothetical protein